MKKQLLFYLGVLLSVSSLVTGCNNPSSSNSTTTDAENKTYLHQKVYDYQTAPDGWEFSEEFSLYDNGMIRFSFSDTYIITKQFESVTKPLNVDLLISLNGGLTLNNNDGGTVKFGVQGLDSKKQVVSESYIEDLNEFPKEFHQGEVTFSLSPVKGRAISYVKVVLDERIKTNTGLPMGIGLAKVRVYTGEGTPNDEIVYDDPFVSGVTYTSFTLQDGPDKSATTGGVTLDQLSKVEGTINTPATGDSRVLVIPVQFPDVVCSDLPGGCDGIRRDLERNFFGVTEETGWESLSSYYYKSSYGQLNLNGRVSSWYMSDITATAALDKVIGDSPTTASNYILESAVNWYRKTYNDIDTFDTNGDGYLDAVVLIYAHPNCGYNREGLCADSRAQELFWAYCYWDMQAKNILPKPITYFWGSYDFMYEGDYFDDNGTPLPDAHTYIHESGHLLGLDDYYNYDRNSADRWGPAGGVDMMDNNVADHNAYSKFLYNWIAPKVVNQSETITIGPFESTGDAIIVPTNTGFKRTPYDEYLIIEYYTPTGLNEKDSLAPYAGNGGGGLQAMTIPGIKIYHVDARLALLGYNSAQSTWSFYQYVDTIGSLPNGSTITTAHKNSTTRQNYDNPNFRLLTLLEADEAGRFKQGRPAVNSTLFQAGANFGVNVYDDFVFNNGSPLTYTFTIDSVDANGVTITFTAK